MKRFVVFLGILGIALCVQAQDVSYGATPKIISEQPQIIEPSELGDFYSSYLTEEKDTFSTYVYTLADIILFSYEDSTELEVMNAAGGCIWSRIMDDGSYHHISPGAGVFFIRGSNKYSVLIGDPVSDLVQGFYAADQDYCGVSERLLTFIPGAWGGSQFIVFAYQDSTQGEIRNLGTGALVDSFLLDSAQHFVMPATFMAVEVTASKGVSALSYGDQGYWVPAANGSFSGELFFTFKGYIGSWPNDVNVIAYYDNTYVRMSNTETGALLWEGDLDEGEVFTLSDSDNNIYVTVEADTDVVCLVAPFVSYATNYARLYNGMERAGYGIGKKFYHPTIEGGRLDIFSFYDDNHVQVHDNLNGGLVWSGTLDAGGYHMIPTNHTVYKVLSDSGVALFDEMAERAGAIFAPLWYASFEPIVDVVEESNSKYPVLNLSSAIVADVLYVQLSNNPSTNFRLELIDITGRRVLSKHFTEPRAAIDVSHLPQGVYFVSAQIGESERQVRKVIIY